MGAGGKKNDKKGEKKKKPRDMAKAAEYAAISKSRTRMKNSAEYKNATGSRKAELLAADKQRVLRLRGQGTGVRGARGGGGGGIAVAVGGGGVGVGVLAVPSGGFGHNFGAGFGPNHHHDKEEEEDEEEEEEEEDEEEEDDDLLRQLGELVARFPGVDPLIILHQVCQWLGINPPALPPQ